MIEAQMKVDMAAALLRPGTPAGEAAAGLPPQPKTVRETGLELSLLTELVAKLVHGAGKIHLPILTGKLRLSVNVLREVLDAMQAEQLVEVAWRGDSELDVQYQLTGAGRQRAAEYSARCRYAGPAPVTLQAYCEQLQRQAARLAQAGCVKAADLAAAFVDDSLGEALRTQLGAALQSSRSLLLFGPSGSGKTTLARKLGQLQQGLVAVPHAILAAGQIIVCYDPRLHQAPSPLLARHADHQRSVDARWMLSRRPVVQVGAELTADMLELRYDARGGVYHAPPHMQASGGMLLVDDLGRQRVAPADLLNRWSGPLETGVDQLAMDGAHKVTLPFDATLVFATGFAPQTLLDEAAMRRIAYKIQVGALSDQHYRALFRQQCRLARIACDEAALDFLVLRLHGQSGRPLLAATPQALLARLNDFASFAGTTARMTIPALEQAWSSLFAGCLAGSVAPAHGPLPFCAAGADPLCEKI